MITLTLPYPISANRYWASRVIKAKASGKWMAMTYVTPEAKAYREQVAWAARAAGVRQPLPWRVTVDLRLYPHRPQDWQKRQRQLGEFWDDTVQCIDIGNAEKILGDALQGIVFTDDRWIWDMRKRRMEPDGYPARVVLTVTPMSRERPQLELLEPRAQVEAALPF